MKLIFKVIYFLFAIPILRTLNWLYPKNRQAILFLPHNNCQFDGYDICNGESSNVLCLLNSMIRDKRFNDFHFFILYFARNKLDLYQKYVQEIGCKNVHFIYFRNFKALFKSVLKCYTIFTDSDYTRVYYRVRTQRTICLNYFGGFIKNDFHRWENHGGFKKYLNEQKKMHYLFDYHLSISDICSKFIALDNCHYYSHFLSLGFPRNDIFFRDNTELRKKIEKLVAFPVNKIFIYVPTHRDYENPDREFYDPSKKSIRSIWGNVEENDLKELETTLAKTNSLIIAKLHPVQKAEIKNVSHISTSHIISFDDLTKEIPTSLNPLMAISDSIITDYTTTVYDFLYVNRPIIYYFYDIDVYRKTRGFFIEPIESICAGHLTYNIQELQVAIKEISEEKDPYREKRKYLRHLFIKYLDGDSADRIKDYFFYRKDQ